MAKRIIISKGTELVRVPADSLMYVSSEGNYSNVVTSDGRSRLVTYQLGRNLRGARCRAVRDRTKIGRECAGFI